MSRFVAASVVLACVLGSGVTAQGFKWWQDERYQRELALSTEQIDRLEEIYQSTGPAMRTHKATLDRLQAELARIVADGTADEATATDAITRVEAARSDLGRTRAVMLYRMRRILTSDQHVKLQVLFDERERERRGHGRPRPQR
ncbi:MAG: Spy/CpxP family protein refolding chaperone [Vicinamibacterales bacterium]